MDMEFEAVASVFKGRGVYGRFSDGREAWVCAGCGKAFWSERQLAGHLASCRQLKKNSIVRVDTGKLVPRRPDTTTTTTT